MKAEEIETFTLKIPIIILFNNIGKTSKIYSGLKSYCSIPLAPCFIILKAFKIAVLFFL